MAAMWQCQVSLGNQYVGCVNFCSCDIQSVPVISVEDKYSWKEDLCSACLHMAAAAATAVVVVYCLVLSLTTDC